MFFSWMNKQSDQACDDFQKEKKNVMTTLNNFLIHLQIPPPPPNIHIEYEKDQLVLTYRSLIPSKYLYLSVRFLNQWSTKVFSDEIENCSKEWQVI